MAKWGPIMPEWRPIGEAPEGEDLLLGVWVETSEGRRWRWWLSREPGQADPRTGTAATHFLTAKDLPRPPRSPADLP
jgi:hypothetical protein